MKYEKQIVEVTAWICAIILITGFIIIIKNL
jgi:hypothetical protein